MDGRARRAWGALSAEQHAAGTAALCLIVATALPWYRRGERGSPRTEVVSALQSEPMLAAAIIVVAVFVIGTLLARGGGVAFHLPGGDGRVIAFAGLWSAAIVVAAMIREPGVSGIRAAAASQTLWWGSGVALATALALAAAGWWMRRRAALSLPAP